MNARNDVLLIRREPQRGYCLPRLQGKWLPRMLTLSLGFRFFPLRCAPPDRFEEILLFLLQRLLASGSLLVFWRRRTSRRTNSRQFLDRAAIQRHRIKIVRSRERHAFFIVREVRICLGVFG